MDLGYDGESAAKAAKVRVLLGAPYVGESDRDPGLRWRNVSLVPRSAGGAWPVPPTMVGGGAGKILGFEGHFKRICNKNFVLHVLSILSL